MQLLRASFHTPPITPGNFPTTVVVRDCDVTVTPEEWVRQMTGGSAPIFVTTQVAPLDGSSLEAAIEEGMRLFNERAPTEINMAIGYYWFAEKLKEVKPYGTLQQKDPSPFGTADCRTILEQLARHPMYRSQNVILINDDHQHIQLSRPDGRQVVITEGRVGR